MKASTAAQSTLRQRIFILPVMHPPSSSEEQRKHESDLSIHQLVQRNVISCIQNEMEERRQRQTSNLNDTITWLIYGINFVHKEMIEEVSSWRHFDYVHLPFNTKYVVEGRNGDSADSHYNVQYPLIEKDVIQHANRLLNISGILPKQTYEIVNQNTLFNLNETLKLFGMNMGFRSCLSGDNTTMAQGGTEEGKIMRVSTKMNRFRDVENGPVSSKSLNMERKKFALVIPFPKSQLPQVLTQLKRWRSYRPCTGVSKVYHDSTDLIFYFHKTENLEMEHSVMKELTKSETASGELRSEFHCFNSNIQFWYANLLGTEDSYPSSANHMFYRLVYDPRLYTQYQYFFYAEPDTYPIRDGWLNRLLNQAYLTESSWWVSGSVYRGSAGSNAKDKSKDGDLGQMFYNLHINGNALYNTVAGFREYLSSVRAKIPTEPFDTAMTRYLFHTSWRVTREEWSHFIYSDFIINLWKTDWKTQDIVSQYPHTFLVHGKQIKDK